MRKKKKPLRKCIVSKELYPKEELIRVVRNKEGEVSVDLTGKKNGRGAYLMLDKEVIQSAQESNALGRHLKSTIPDQIYDELIQIVESERIE